MFFFVHFIIFCLCQYIFCVHNVPPPSLLEAAPGRFLGVASGDIRDPVRCVAGVKQYVQKHGFVAVRMLGTTARDADK